MPPVKQKKRTSLGEEEGSKLLSMQQQPPVSTAKGVDQEIQLYRSLPPIPTKYSASLWWWKKSDTLPVFVSSSWEVCPCPSILHPFWKGVLHCWRHPKSRKVSYPSWEGKYNFFSVNLPKLKVVVLSLHKTSLYFLCPWNFVSSWMQMSTVNISKGTSSFLTVFSLCF